MSDSSRPYQACPKSAPRHRSVSISDIARAPEPSFSSPLSARQQIQVGDRSSPALFSPYNILLLWVESLVQQIDFETMNPGH
ncbi:hypothetical protein DM860_005097 [Cuscuta australis]|uniref:Uncharacterized protein n=1 Tax=Cuscuta australis TaxID=267555 RepID=A0A328DQ74_9ASTE|nr:hypothetical protein DM860_005097 [Cuscuta australis]